MKIVLIHASAEFSLQQLRHYFAFRKTPLSLFFSFPSFPLHPVKLKMKKRDFNCLWAKRVKDSHELESPAGHLFFITSRGKENERRENWMCERREVEDPEHQVTNVIQVRLHHALYTMYVRKHCSRLDVSHESSLIFPPVVSWIMSQMCPFYLSAGTHAHLESVRWRLEMIRVMVFAIHEHSPSYWWG